METKDFDFLCVEIAKREGGRWSLERKKEGATFKIGTTIDAH